MVSIGRVISTAIQFIDGFTRPSQEVIKSMSKMADNMKRNARDIQKAGKAISSIGSTMAKGITIPIMGIATAALKMSNDFENAMAKVGTIADTTETPMDTLKKQVVDLSNTVGVGVSDIAEAQYQAISAGVNTAASVDFVSTAVKAAKGGFTDTTTAVDGLTTVLNAYSFEASKATQISGQMLLAQNFGKTSFGDMASSMGKVIPIASSLNVSTEELFGSIAVLTKNGIATSEAVTGLKAAYSNILKPSADASKTAHQLGLDFSSAHLQSVGWAKFLDEIKEKTGGNAETMAKLFGSTEALNSVTVLAGKGYSDFAKVLGQMNSAEGMTQTAYEKMLTPTERMNISFNKIKNSLIQFGAALTPAFNKAAEIIGAVGDKLNSLSEGQVNAIVKFAGIAAAIGPAIMIFGKAVSMVGKVQKNIAGAIKIFTRFKGILGVITSPAGIVIGILAAIALAAFLIIKNWDQVKGVLQDVGNWFKNAFEKAGFSAEGFIDKFKSIWNTLKDIAGKIGDICKNVAGVFKREFAGKITDAAEGISTFLESAVGGIAVVFDGIVNAVDTGLGAFDALLGFFIGGFKGEWDSAASGLRDSIKNIFPQDTADDLIQAFDSALPYITEAVEGIKKAFGGIVEEAKKIFESVKKVFGGFGDFLKGIFTGDTEMAVNGFKEIIEGVIDTIGNIIKAKFDMVKNFVLGALGSFLPQETMNKISGAFDVVSDAWDTAIGAIKGFIGGLIDTIRAIPENIRNAVDNIKDFFSRMGGAIKKAFEGSGVDVGKFGEKIRNIKYRVGNIIENLKNIFKHAFEKIGKHIKKAADIVANIFGKKTENACGETESTINSFKRAVEAVFDAISRSIKKAMDFIVPVIKVAFEAAGGAISSAVDSITSITDGVLTVFDGLITFISGVFTGNWRQAWEGVKSIFKGIFDTFAAICRAPINAVIGIINGAISAINKLGITIPDWVPVIGGREFQLNVPTIPMLYKGTNNWQGGMAVIHDRGGEIVDLPQGSRVYPHDKSIEMARTEGKRNGSGSVSINIQKLADKIEVRSDKDIDRIAEALAYKLKKIALNTGTA